MDETTVMRFARAMGYAPEDVREARHVLREANVPEVKIASVLRLLADAAACDGVDATLAALAVQAAQQAEKEE